MSVAVEELVESTAPVEVPANGHGPEIPPQEPAARELPPLTTCLAGALAAAAAAWMVGGVFRGIDARVICELAALGGAALVYASFRLERAWLQYLLLPAALLAGAALVAPDAHAGTGSLPALVQDAIRSGGILQPPIDLAPGWKLILAVLFTMLGGGAAALGVALERPRLAAAMPLPVALGASLIQPSDSEVFAAAVAVVLVVAALALSYGADLTREGPVGGSFERVRLLRSAGLVAGLVVAVVALSQLGFLFPTHEQQHVVPPTRPQLPPPVPDVPLFEVRMSQQVPLRLGVIDTYQGGAWLLPPYDTSRFERLQPPAAIPAPPSDEPPGPARPPKTITVDITVAQATGHLLPDVAWTTYLSGLGLPVDYDPETNTFRLATRPVFTGIHYTATAGVPPDSAALRKAGRLPKQVKPYLNAPPTPIQVQTILANAPQSPIDRLQFVRKALYDKVVASGGGVPTDVSPVRVVQMLNGGEANPYEITAAEALLARWAGIPSRIGYGYFPNTKLADGAYEIRPRDGATWLEAYFAGYGWQPITGVPPQAKPSLSQHQKNPTQHVVAINQLGLIVYLPVRVHTLLPLYVVVRYWLLRALAAVALLAVAWTAYPGLVKMERRRRRRAWARERGPRARVAVAYSEFRDTARDLAVGDALATPLEFVDAVEPDEEHSELAWLATRALWGDLRPVNDETALDAERMAASVVARLARAQPVSTRLLGFVARTSLRDPYSREVPNLWWSERLRQALAGALAGRRRRRLVLRAAPATAALLVAATVGASCGGSQAALTSRPLPGRLVPDSIGRLTFKEEPKAEIVYLQGRRDPDVIVEQGRVFTFRHDGIVEGAVEFARFKPGYTGADPEVAAAIRASVGSFEPVAARLPIPIWVSAQPDVRIYLWFPTTSDSMALLIARKQFTARSGDALARALVEFALGRRPAAVPIPASSPGGGPS